MSNLHLVQFGAAKLSGLSPVLQLYLLVLWKQKCPILKRREAKSQLIKDFKEW